MADIYDFDINIVIPNITPPIKRLPKYLAWLLSLVSPIQTAWQNLFADWKTGSAYYNYNPLSIYNPLDKVIYTDNAVYECLQVGTLGINCLNTNYWNKVNDTYIGADERIKYHSQIITLEYILNKNFNNLSATDQIYIVNESISSSNFIMGRNAIYSSDLAKVSNFSTSFMGLSPTFPVQYNMTIMFPLALYTSLNTTISNRSLIVRNLVDKYILAGIIYKIQTY